MQTKHFRMKVTTRVLWTMILLCAFLSNSNRTFGQAAKSQLKVTILDKKSSQPTPVRVHVTDKDGITTHIPHEAISIMYGRNDKPEMYEYQPDSSFYVDGVFSLELDTGIYFISLSKGVEYLEQLHMVHLDQEEHQKIFTMERWIHMADSGWYSGDEHIHIRRSPRENPLLLKWMEAEDIHVGVLLQMGDFRNTYFGQFAFGDKGVYQEGNHILSPGQEEPRTHQVGHTIALMADEFVRMENKYYNYDQIFDRVHELSGITGYAHQGVLFQGYRGMTMDVLSNRVDFLEILQFCAEGGPLLTMHYYHFLDLGFKLTATAGSDFPWCGNGPAFGVEGSGWNARIGNVRFYTHIGNEFSYKRWKKNVKEGHTFVSSGPMIDFKVNGQIPGDQIDLKKASTLTIEAKGYGHPDQVPLSKLEIIAHGEVIDSVTLNDPNQSAGIMSIEIDLPVDQGVWIAARCYAGPSQAAHTTPVYVTVNGGGFQNSKTYSDYLFLNEKYLEELEAELESPHENLEYRAYWYKKGLETRIKETREIIEELKE